jgi:hypothetical protein
MADNLPSFEMLSKDEPDPVAAAGLQATTMYGIVDRSAGDALDYCGFGCRVDPRFIDVLLLLILVHVESTLLCSAKSAQKKAVQVWKKEKEGRQNTR